jgi:hypothetical protein
LTPTSVGYIVVVVVIVDVVSVGGVVVVAVGFYELCCNVCSCIGAVVGLQLVIKCWLLLKESLTG